MNRNVFIKKQNDYKTAISYLEKAISLDNNSYIAYNNLAGIYAQQGDIDKAKQYFLKSYSLNNKYHQTLYGLALLNYNSSNYFDAFEYIIESLKIPNNEIHSNCINLAFEISKQYSKTLDPDEFYKPFLGEIEKIAQKLIILTSDPNISVQAKLEIAEYHNRPSHKLIVKEFDILTLHKIFHELYHLKFIIDARSENENEIFTSNNISRDKFLTKCNPFKKQFVKKGFKPEMFNEFMIKLFDGLNLQMYNAPIDLFIEQAIFDNFPKLRPVQFLSLYKMHLEAVNSALDKKVKEFTPSFVWRSNVILTITQLIQLEELFGVDLKNKISDNSLFNIANKLYDEYKRLQNDKYIGEEYDLIKRWEEDLNLIDYFK